LNFDLPPDVILPVERIDVRLDMGVHPFERNHAQAIEENWRRETTRNPALFDGTVVLLSSLAYRGGELSGTCHPVRFATFMHWRNNRETPGTAHAFAHAMLVSGDGALVAIRMGSHTVSAGRVYFAAGSFEPSDFFDGQVDVDYNMVREVREETGIDLERAARGQRCHVLATLRGTVIFRRYRMVESADAIAALIERHVANEAEPEISGPVIIRSADDLPEGLMPHMLPLVQWHFANPVSCSQL
jgi:8-oxo-dGTP pyrophosphatase MutT (NUDIX family)